MSTVDEIVLPLPDDFHVHLRDGAAMAYLSQFNLSSFFLQ